MSSNPYSSGANAFACMNSMLRNQTHRIDNASGHSIIYGSQLREVGLDLRHAEDCTSMLTIGDTDIVNCTLLTRGALNVDRSSLRNSRISAAHTMKFDYSFLRKIYLRMQPGTGLELINNDADELTIEGGDSFSHVFNLEGLFTLSRFNGLKIFDGHVKAIFYKTQWKALLIRQSTFINTLFSHCFMQDVVIKDSKLINVTFMACTISGVPLTFVGCCFNTVRFIGVKRRDCLMINCTGLSTVSFDG